jgi:hypothetical protein
MWVDFIFLNIDMHSYLTFLTWKEENLMVCEKVLELDVKSNALCDTG